MKYRGHAKVIFDLLRAHPEGLTREQLMCESGTSSSTLIRIIARMKEEGDADSLHIYRLTPKAIEETEKSKGRQIIAGSRNIKNHA